MTQETFEIVKGMDLTKIETKLVLQCAPLITGLKISNLLIVPVDTERMVRVILRKSGISCYRLLISRGKITFLLFRRMELEQFLLKKDIQRILSGQGYKGFGLESVLSVFQTRYQAYKDGKFPFPHEMGILLGYPVEDVEGFMSNNGKNYLYSGYWKVYGNMQEKIVLFQRYQTAKETLIRLLASGLKIEEIIRQYGNKELQKAVV